MAHTYSSKERLVSEPKVRATVYEERGREDHGNFFGQANNTGAGGYEGLGSIPKHHWFWQVFERTVCTQPRFRDQTMIRTI